MKNLKDNKIRCTCHLKPDVIDKLDLMQKMNSNIKSRNEAIERAVRVYADNISIIVKECAFETVIKENKANISKDTKEWAKIFEGGVMKYEKI